jgi:hypothetical protein
VRLVVCLLRVGGRGPAGLRANGAKRRTRKRKGPRACARPARGGREAGAALIR